MRPLLPLLAALFLAISAAQAKPDVGKILGGIVEAGGRVVQQSESVNALQQEWSEIRESYKEEGRAYARELGDIMTERFMADKKVNNTLDSVRALCWGVVAYITLISLLLFGMMLRISALLKQLRRASSLDRRPNT